MRAGILKRDAEMSALADAVQPRQRRGPVRANLGPERAVPGRRLLSRAQAGEEPLARLAADAGFARFRRVAETPFNIVYEARR